MATMAVIPGVPQMPDAVKQSLGEAATARLELLERRLTEYELRGDLKPATIFNQSPFALSLGSGLIPYEIKAAPHGKPFHAETIRTHRSYPTFLGNTQLSDKSIRSKWDVNILTPVQQLMEFKHAFVGESEEDNGVKQGGVVVVLGEFDGMTPKSEVEYPVFLFRKNNRYIAKAKAVLGELLATSEKMMKLKCQLALDQANIWFDNEKTRANIQNSERVWHDFALRKQWITQPLAWRTAQAPESSRCPRCAQQYVSKTGVCKCSFVYEPLIAYMSGEIEIDHVRMNTLNAEQWKKVKAEQARREEARK